MEGTTPEAALGRQQHGPQRRRAAPPCELTVESTDGDPEWKAAWAELEAASFDQAWATATNDTGTEWEYRLMTDMHPYHRLEDRLDKAMAAWFACAAACADFWLIRTLHSDLPVQLVRLWQLLRAVTQATRAVTQATQAPGKLRSVSSLLCDRLWRGMVNMEGALPPLPRRLVPYWWRPHLAWRLLCDESDADPESDELRKYNELKALVGGVDSGDEDYEDYEDEVGSADEDNDDEKHESVRAALRVVSDELFDAKEDMPEQTYLRLSGALKRAHEQR